MKARSQDERFVTEKVSGLVVSESTRWQRNGGRASRRGRRPLQLSMSHLAVHGHRLVLVAHEQHCVHQAIARIHFTRAATVLARRFRSAAFCCELRAAIALTVDRKAGNAKIAEGRKTGALAILNPRQAFGVL